MLLFATGELEAGVALVVQAARRIQERIGDHEGGGVALSFLAQMTFAKGDPARALARPRQAGRRRPPPLAGRSRRATAGSSPYAKETTR